MIFESNLVNICLLLENNHWLKEHLVMQLLVTHSTKQLCLEPFYANEFLQFWRYMFFVYSWNRTFHIWNFPRKRGAEFCHKKERCWYCVVCYVCHAQIPHFYQYSLLFVFHLCFFFDLISRYMTSTSDKSLQVIQVTALWT